MVGLGRRSSLRPAVADALEEVSSNLSHSASRRASRKDSRKGSPKARDEDPDKDPDGNHSNSSARGSFSSQRDLLQPVEVLVLFRATAIGVARRAIRKRSAERKLWRSLSRRAPECPQQCLWEAACNSLSNSRNPLSASLPIL